MIQFSVPSLCRSKPPANRQPMSYEAAASGMGSGREAALSNLGGRLLPSRWEWQTTPRSTQPITQALHLALALPLLLTAAQSTSSKGSSEVFCFEPEGSSITPDRERVERRRPHCSAQLLTGRGGLTGTEISPALGKLLDQRQPRHQSSSRGFPTVSTTV